MKSCGFEHLLGLSESHPSRGAWIEMQNVQKSRDVEGRTPHGVRGLKFRLLVRRGRGRGSHPSRGAWIEIIIKQVIKWLTSVAPLTGCVD